MSEPRRKPARERALGWLARREYARRELVMRLLRSGYDAEEAEGAVGDLADQGLQSDDRYAEFMVRSRHAHGHGPFRIRVELQQRGVDDSLIRRHLEADEYDWSEAAARALHKRFGGAPPEDARERARRQRFLGRRGFDHEQIDYALTRSYQEDEEH